MKRVFITAIAFVTLALFCFGCSSGTTSSGSSTPDYADDEAMGIIADGWNQRSAIIEGDSSSSGSDNGTNWTAVKRGIQTEIDNDASLKNRPFEDTQMQEDVIAYLNSLDDQMNVLDNYSQTDFDFYDQWSKAYNKRSVLLKKFVDEYGFSVDSKYQEALDQILANGSQVNTKNDQQNAINSLFANAQWEKSGSEYYEYTTVVTNTTDYNFKSVSLTVSLYDADGVKTESFASANSWNKGEKMKFTASSNVDAQKVVASVEYFDIAD